MDISYYTNGDYKTKIFCVESCPTYTDENVAMADLSTFKTLNIACGDSTGSANSVYYSDTDLADSTCISAMVTGDKYCSCYKAY